MYTDTVSIVVESVAIRGVQLRLPRRVRARKRGRVRVFLLPPVHGACLSMSAWTLFTTTSSYCGQTDFRVVSRDSAADPSPDLGHPCAMPPPRTDVEKAGSHAYKLVSPLSYQFAFPDAAEGRDAGFADAWRASCATSGGVMFPMDCILLFVLQLVHNFVALPPSKVQYQHLFLYQQSFRFVDDSEFGMGEASQRSI